MQSNEDNPTAHTVAIIGGGFSGIAAAHALSKTSVEFTVFEASDKVGGTWNFNRFPGAEVDTPSHLYSFSFHPGDWSRPYAQQAELEGYLNEVVDTYGLREHFRFNTRISSVVWDESSQLYQLTTTDGSRYRFKYVISAVGLLNVPNHPDWPGRKSYKGKVVHTARWEDHDFRGKSVAVVGTGSTAAQVVPALAPLVKELTLFQRQPGWVDPKPAIIFTESQRTQLRKPFQRKAERLKLYLQQERRWFGGRILKPGSTVDVTATQVCRDYLDEVFSDRPDLKKALTPTSPYMGKRPIHSSTFYPALLRTNVKLVPRAVQAMSPSGLIDSDGHEHKADIVITATGFQPAKFLTDLEVIGRNGRSIHDRWGVDPEAFLGVAVDGFPNFFMMYGPNTNYYALVFNFEQQAKFIVRSVIRTLRLSGSATEVRPEFVAIYNSWLQRRLRKSSFATEKNYFASSSGRIVTQFADSVSVYWILMNLLRTPAMEVLRRPLLRSTSESIFDEATHELERTPRPAVTALGLKPAVETERG